MNQPPPPASRTRVTLAALSCAIACAVLPIWVVYTQMAHDARKCSPIARYEFLLHGLQLDAEIDSLRRLADNDHYNNTKEQCIPCSGLERTEYNTSTWEGLRDQVGSSHCDGYKTINAFRSMLLTIQQFHHDDEDPCTLPDHFVHVWYTKYIFLGSYVALVSTFFPMGIALVHSVAALTLIEPTNALTVQELRNGAELASKAASATHTAWSDWRTTRRDRHTARRLHVLRDAAIDLPPELLQITNSLLDDQPTLREAFT